MCALFLRKTTTFDSIKVKNQPTARWRWEWNRKGEEIRKDETQLLRKWSAIWWNSAQLICWSKALNDFKWKMIITIWTRAVFKRIRERNSKWLVTWELSSNEDRFLNTRKTRKKTNDVYTSHKITYIWRWWTSIRNRNIVCLMRNAQTRPATTEYNAIPIYRWSFHLMLRRMPPFYVRF